MQLIIHHSKNGRSNWDGKFTVFMMPYSWALQDPHDIKFINVDACEFLQVSTNVI